MARLKYAPGACFYLLTTLGTVIESRSPFTDKAIL